MPPQFERLVLLGLAIFPLHVAIFTFNNNSYSFGFSVSPRFFEWDLATTFNFKNTRIYNF